MKKKILIILLLWQLCGVVVTLIVSIPSGNFHVFVHELIMCLSLTNGVALLCGLYYLIYKKLLMTIINRTYIRYAVSVCSVALIIAVSAVFALKVGGIICGFDDYVVSRWHLMLVIINMMVLTASTVAVILYFIHQNITGKLADNVREIEKLKLLQVESKLSLLQSKINPHFLFNTLNTLLDIVKTNTDDVENIIMNLSNIYRKTLTTPDNELVCLQDELELVNEYLEIEKFRMGDRLNYEFNIDEKLRTYTIPPMIIQMLVENAVKHGLSPKTGPGTISISAEIRSDLIEIEVTDNGTGMPPEKEHSGFGLYSIQQRIKLQYGDRGKLLISTPDSGGTRVRIELPYEIENSHS